MAGFKSYLMSLDGKRREEHTATAIIRDIGKVLQESKPCWAELAVHSNLLGFMELLKARKMQADGQLTKLERIVDALTYAEMAGHIDEDSASKILRSIVKWKTLLRGEKTRRNVERLEKMSDEPLKMKSISDVVDDSVMWKKFERALARARDGRSLSNGEIRVVTGFLALVIKLKSYQR